MRGVVAALALVAALGASRKAEAGPWTTGGPGHFNLQFGVGYYFTSSQFDDAGKMAPVQIFQYMENTFPAQVDSTYRSLDLSIYAEIGIFKRLDLIFYLPFWRRITQDYPDNPNFSVSGVGDGNIWLNANFVNNRYLVMSLRGGLELPLGDSNASDAYPSPFETKRLPMPLGDKELAGEVSLLFGHSFYPVPLFLTAEFGARFRGGQEYDKTSIRYSDDLPFAVQLGYQLFIRKFIWCWLPEVDFLISIRGIGSVKNGRVEGPPPAGYSYNLYLPNNQSYIQLGPTINFHLWKYFSLSARYERVVWGQNTGAGNIFGFSIGMTR